MLAAYFTALAQVVTNVKIWLEENAGSIGEKVGELVGKLAQYIIQHLPIRISFVS